MYERAICHQSIPSFLYNSFVLSPKSLLRKWIVYIIQVNPTTPHMPFLISDTIILIFISCLSPISLRYISNSRIGDVLEMYWRCIGDMMCEETRISFEKTSKHQIRDIRCILIGLLISVGEIIFRNSVISWRTYHSLGNEKKNKFSFCISLVFS